MKIEHVAYPVQDPVAVAAWYVEHLGLRIVRQTGPPTDTHFLSDGAGGRIEFYNNPKVRVPDYATMDPLLLHVAFVVDDIRGTWARLLAAGCAAADEARQNDTGDELAMLRDPWGFAIQLVKRETELR